ncbi:MAG TPA: sigma-70 family RNA polymerase sigma factor [Bacteroidia bacterium]|jgi:RNA polymerase sigma factor (sigma-70 family)|nr:sigma-70 family RNA polymerase sigma factor [Bacteroidia bacterium]
MSIKGNKAGMSKAAMQFTDQQFLQGLREGDSEVLSALYKRYYNIVLKLVVNNSGSSDEAADIYQESIIVLFENSEKPGFELKCQLQTYLYSVAKRLWLKQLKRKGRTYLMKEEEESYIVDVTEDLSLHQKKELDFERIEKSLVELGEPCAGLIRDFYVLQLSMEEIAEKFGYTNSDNAKNQKYKCLQRLKKYFFESNNEERE